MLNAVVVLAFLVLCCSVFIKGDVDLNPDVPPGKNFDLSSWKLTLPDKDVTEITGKELADGYESEYFFTDKSDGSMSFWCPANGGTTGNSEYPRSELRHNCNPSSDHYNWGVLNGTYSVDATYVIDQNHTAPKTVFQQIHAFNGEPLTKVQWQLDNGKDGNVYVFYQEDSSGKNEKKVLLGKVDYDKFTFETKVDHGSLQLYLNGKEVLKENVSYWSNYGNYFKVGDYLQDNSGNAYDIVHVYALKVVIDGACTYYD